MHGRHERAIVGELVAPDREYCVLATKYTINERPTDPNAGGSHRKCMVQALDASLKGLGTDYIDVYWLHVWDAFTPVEEVVRILDDAVSAGKVLYVRVLAGDGRRNLKTLVPVGAPGDRDTADVAGPWANLVYVHDVAVLLDLHVAAALLGQNSLRPGHGV